MTTTALSEKALLWPRRHITIWGIGTKKIHSAGLSQQAQTLYEEPFGL
jgi:hypothetical protein